MRLRGISAPAKPAGRGRLCGPRDPKGPCWMVSDSHDSRGGSPNWWSRPGGSASWISRLCPNYSASTSRKSCTRQSGGSSRRRGDNFPYRRAFSKTWRRSDHVLHITSHEGSVGAACSLLAGTSSCPRRSCAEGSRMRLDRTQLIDLAASTGFRQETLEKVDRLVGLLDDVNRHPLLSKVLALKGGTALNLGFGPPSRLSVDLDFNYVGAADREAMLAQRPEVERAMESIARAQGYRVQRSREE